MKAHRWLLAVLPLSVAPVAMLTIGTAAHAASCRVMTVRYDVSGRGLVVLDPDHYDIPYAGCVQFVNQTAATTTITVGERYSQTLGPNENTTTATSYHGSAPGQQQVTATSGPAGSSAHGSITVGPPPARSPAPSPPTHHTRSATPAPASPPPSSAGSGPQVAPTPARAHHHGGKHGGLQPPVSPPGPVQTQIPTPAPTPTRSAAAVAVAGPVEPPTGRGIGLPAALAAVAVVGGAAAFVRVLAAEPVDDGKTVAGSS